MSSKLATRQDDITRVAIAMLQTHFVAAKKEAFRPRAGTLMHKLWTERRLTERQQVAWHNFTEDLHGWRGKSGSVTSNYGESVGGGEPSDLKIPTAFSDFRRRRLDALVNFLSPFERSMLTDLIADELEVKGLLDLEVLGLYFNGYKSGDMARATAVGKITYFLDRLSAFYNVR